MKIQDNIYVSYKYGTFVFHNSVKISFYASEKGTEKNEIGTWFDLSNQLQRRKNQKTQSICEAIERFFFSSGLEPHIQEVLA